MYSSVIVIYQAVLIRQYQFFCAVFEVFNMVERGLSKYGL